MPLPSRGEIAGGKVSQCVYNFWLTLASIFSYSERVNSYMVSRFGPVQPQTVAPPVIYTHAGDAFSGMIKIGCASRHIDLDLVNRANVVMGIQTPQFVSRFLTPRMSRAFDSF